MMREPRFAQQPIIVDDTGRRFCPPRISISTSTRRAGNGRHASVRRPGAGILVFRPLGRRCVCGCRRWVPDVSGWRGGNVFPWMDRVDVNYSSWLHSFELNSLCCSGCCDQCDSGKGGDKGSVRAATQVAAVTVRCRSFEWFGGFRYINLGEELNIIAQGAVPGERRLQHSHRQSPLRWAARGEVATLAGSVRLGGGWQGRHLRQRCATDAIGGGLSFTIRPTVSSRGGQVAFVGEINLSALCRLTDVWNLRAGYNTMWIEGLALAPDQLDFNFATAERQPIARRRGPVPARGEPWPGGALVRQTPPHVGDARPAVWRRSASRGRRSRVAGEDPRGRQPVHLAQHGQQSRVLGDGLGGAA